MSLYSEITADAPVAYWPMQETSGLTLVDDAGSNNATLVAPFTLDAHAGPDCAGPTNRSVEFENSGAWDGGSWATAANILSGNVDACVECVAYVNPGGLAQVPTFVSQRGGVGFTAVQQSYIVEADTDGTFIVRWAASAAALSAPGAVREGCWNHLFVEHEASTQLVKGWVNGCPAGSFTTSGSLSASFGTRIVSDWFNDPGGVNHLLDGYMAHVAVYNHVGHGDTAIHARARALCARCRGLCEGHGWGVGNRFGGSGWSVS